MAERGKSSEPGGKPEPDYAGHRRRLRERIRKAGAEALQDYELMELVLFLCLPRRDTKSIAKALVRRFGSFSEALSAPDKLLREIGGIGPQAAADLKIVLAAAQRFGRDSVPERVILDSWSSLIEYCRAQMAYEQREQFRVLFLDKRNKLIADEVQQVGTVDHTPVYPREVIRRALELSATALILVHNHPSGDPAPSDADVEMTRAIAKIAKPLGIALHDHIIVGREGHASMQALKLI